MRLLYCRSNSLIRMFNKCSQNVLSEICRSFCTTFYCPYFWTLHKNATLHYIIATAGLVNALITTHLDFCNSILYNLLRKRLRKCFLAMTTILLRMQTLESVEM